MNYETIILGKKESIATITLNRPERLNAMSRELGQELMSALDDVDNDNEMRVLVITGAGRAFCAGGDTGRINERLQRDKADPEDAESRRGLIRSEDNTTLKLQKMQKPTIAMVNGPAVGAGCNLALACDLRVGSENARFRNAFIVRGHVNAEGGTWLYPQVMGLPKALEYLLTGDFIEAKEAERIGALNHLVPAEELEKETMSLARKIANGPPIAMRLTRLHVYKGLGMDLETAIQMVAPTAAITWASEDYKEGAAAFLEKRPARFQGR